jgi:hypothetical protein
MKKVITITADLTDDDKEWNVTLSAHEGVEPTLAARAVLVVKKFVESLCEKQVDAPQTPQ